MFFNTYCYLTRSGQRTTLSTRRWFCRAIVALVQTLHSDFFHRQFKFCQSCFSSYSSDVFAAGEYDDLIASKCAVLEQELNEERSQHQSRIKDYNRLEQRYDNLKVSEWSAGAWSFVEHFIREYERSWKKLQFIWWNCTWLMPDDQVTAVNTKVVDQWFSAFFDLRHTNNQSITFFAAHLMAYKQKIQTLKNKRNF